MASLIRDWPALKSLLIPALLLPFMVGGFISFLTVIGTQGLGSQNVPPIFYIASYLVGFGGGSLIGTAIVARATRSLRVYVTGVLGMAAGSVVGGLIMWGTVSLALAGFDIVLLGYGISVLATMGIGAASLAAAIPIVPDGSPSVSGGSAAFVRSVAAVGAGWMVNLVAGVAMLMVLRTISTAATAVTGSVAALLGGYTAGTVAGRAPVLHAAALAAVMLVPSLWATGLTWGDRAIPLISAVATVAGGLIRSWTTGRTRP